MNAGQRDRLIDIEKATKTQDSESGQETLAWGPLAGGVWANVRHVRGTEGLSAEQPVALVETIFNIRYREDLSPNEIYSVVYDGRRFEITAVLAPVGAARRSELELYTYARAEALPG